jgi:hypothetical protein
MKVLSPLRMKEITAELRELGVGEVIDAQNVSSFIRKKRKGSSDSEKIDHNNDMVKKENDDFLEALSLGKEKSLDLLHKLSEKKIKENDITIDQIDWKNVKTF